MTIQHRNIPEAQLHEPKGASTALAGQTYIADGAGSGAWKDTPDPTGVADGQIFVADGANSITTQTPLRMGWWDYNDSATAGTPIVLSSAGTFFDLTNDGLGLSSNKSFKLPEVEDVWDASTNRFDFTSLKLGDVVHLRVDTSVTTNSSNDVITLVLDYGLGGAPSSLKISREQYKTAGTYNKISMFSFYMGNSNILNNPAKLKMSSDTGTTNTVVVNGWFIEVMSQGSF
jgi:hypothetical protein